MRLVSYAYKEEPEGWEFDEVKFTDLNLIVGVSGSGKTRFLTTIFNLGRVALGTGQFGKGSWRTTFEHNESIYEWTLQCSTEKGRQIISQETLSKGSTTLVKRNQDSFMFKGNEIPQLDLEKSCMSLLREEEEIKPLHDGFLMLRRRFAETPTGGLVGLDMIDPSSLLEGLKELRRIATSPMSLNSRLFALKKNFQEVFDQICELYKEIFPFIKRVDVKDFMSFRSETSIPSLIPVFCIKESNMDWLPLHELSSGMQKVLLILTDMLTIQNDGTYLIDEYENSLGVHAIDVLPLLLSEIKGDVQLFITSHHPYIINEIPPQNWLVLHRKGSRVSFRYGEENVQRFGKSKQKYYIQLLNDDFYDKGAE